MDNTKLRSVIFKDGIGVEKINNFAFANNPKLVMNYLPDSVNEIGSYAFFANTSMTEFRVSENVNIIGYSAFGMCTSLVEIALPFVGGHAYTDNYTVLIDETTRVKLDSAETLFGYIFGTEGNELTYKAYQVHIKELMDA